MSAATKNKVYNGNTEKDLDSSRPLNTKSGGKKSTSSRAYGNSMNL